MPEKEAIVNILIAEDSPTHAFHIRNLLEKNGYTVQIAKDGQEAWEILTQGEMPDILISDIYMPRMDGFTLSRKIREHPVISQVPVILITSFSDKMDIIYAMLSGARYLLSRPFEENQLVQRVENALIDKSLPQHTENRQQIDLYYDGTHHAIQNDPMQLIHLLLSTYETTIQKSAAQRKLASDYDMIFNSTQDAIFLIEVVGPGEFRYLRTNKAHQKASGISLDEIQGKTPQQLLGEELGNQIASNYQRCMESSQPLTYEETLDLPGGRRTWLTTLTPVIEDGAPSYIVGSGTEITKLKGIEQALRVSEANAQAASRAKSQFLSHMSHEIRTPLSGVIGFAELLSHTQMNEEQQLFLGYITSSAECLSALVNDVLDLAKIEEGKMELNIGPTSIEEICRSAIDSVRHTASKKKLSLSLDVDPYLTDILIEVDGNRLRQVLLNLLSNAVKFTEEGSVTFSVRLEKPFDHDGYGEIRFCVEDTGPGIDEKDQKRIFEEIFQTDASDTRKHLGTGLGLSISQHLLNLMGSRMSLISQLGIGSTFSFLLKARGLSISKNHDGFKGSEDTKPQEKKSTDWKSKPHKILMIEDNTSNQKLIGGLLEKEFPNASISIAKTGLEGIDLWKSLHPALILMDLLMPEMGGIEATRIIRSQEDEGHTPIIVLTAVAEAQTQEECFRAGVDG